MLHTPKFNEPFVLQMDTSAEAIAVLLQMVEGMERPIAYASRKLNEHEKRYAMVEQECLAIKCGVEYFWYSLLG